MTPDSVMKAMAKALAEKFTSRGMYDGKLAKYNKSLEERINSGMMRSFADWDGNMSIQPVTPREAAVEVMDSVVGPILELMAEMQALLVRANRELGEMALDLPDGPSAEYHMLSCEIARLEAKSRMQQPADWDYVRRFSATPHEIHDILRSGLHPKVLKAYVDAVKAGEFDQQS
jgi:hypothetical protein